MDGNCTRQTMIKPGKHILILSPGFPADEQDSTCIPMLQNYIRAYFQQYPEDTISVISFQYPAYKNQVLWHNIEVFTAGGGNKKFPGRLLTWKQCLDYFKQLHKVHPVDIIHSFWLNECTLLGQYIASKNKIGHIATAMGQDCLKENRYLRLLKINKMSVVNLSESMDARLSSSVGKKADHIIPFGLYKPAARKTRERNIDILGVGSIIPVKDYPLFMEVIAALKQEFPALCCMVIGNQPDPDELAKVKSIIAHENLGNNVILKGQLEPEAVYDYMVRSRIFLHTSKYEGQGLVLMEAQSSGMTTVCFDVGRTYPEKTIICRDKEEMIVALRSLLLDKELNFEPIFHETMEDTAAAYHKLYYKNH